MLRGVKLLFIGDVVGEPGRKAVKALVPKLRSELGLDVVIANGENSAGGSGITVATANELFKGGVDIITSGDHLWDQKEVSQLLASEPRFVRPINYPPETPGSGVQYFERDALKVAIINAQGRTFMPDLENPFRVLQARIAEIKEKAQIIFVDVHAEATSEKIALARMLDGQVSAVIGTHTHVQTADEQIFPGGTAFLCDAGFTGAHESILGRDITPIIERFLTNQPRRFTVAGERVFLQGSVVEIDESTGRAVSIRRISEPLHRVEPN
jgi:metallophosphoesterase (TIGR00282 family)